MDDCENYSIEKPLEPKKCFKCESAEYNPMFVGEGYKRIAVGIKCTQNECPWRIVLKGGFNVPDAKIPNKKEQIGQRVKSLVDACKEFPNHDNRITKAREPTDFSEISFE
ncbi:MAG: hypothetical protein ABIG37_00170 [Nanoarchaeota archaeon]|nr:hypothetical protein [Nanoarchaeota archaeon]